MLPKAGSPGMGAVDSDEAAPGARMSLSEYCDENDRSCLTKSRGSYESEAHDEAEQVSTFLLGRHNPPKATFLLKCAF
jgi:hypothetical protein